jgi:guanylate kinase
MEIIKTWLKEFPKNKEVCLLVTGASGVGKSKKVKNILKEQGNYHIHYFNTTNFNKKGIIREHFNKIIQISNIWVMMNQSKKPIIVIDELEGISVNDRGSINEIIDLVKAVKTSPSPIPIICIGNDQYFKKQKELAKWCTSIYIKPPTKEELLIYLKQLIDKENISISKNTVEKLLDESQRDYHRLENLFKYMCLESKTTFKITDLNKIISSTDKKQVNINLYEATKKLLYEDISLQDTMKWFYEEKTLLPLMIHQNYQLTNDKNMLAKISDILSYSNILEGCLYQKNEWDLLNYYGLMSCFIPSQLLKAKYQKDIVYTKMLNKISLKYTYMQKMREKTLKKPEYYFDQTFQRYNIKNLYNTKNAEEAVKYGLTVKQLNDMIKYI